MELPPLHLPGPLALVDDNEDDLALMQHLLKKSGLASDVRAFHGGDEIIAALQRRTAAGEPRMAAFCIDVKMPGMTGAELLAWIRGQPEYAHVPVVMCSTSEDPRDIDSAARHGAQAYVAKYPKPEAMREILVELERWQSGNHGRKHFDVGCNLLPGRDLTPNATEPG